MRTGRSFTVCWSLLRGGGLDLIPLNFPPWVWAWIWSPQFPSLGVGLDLIPLNFPLCVGLDLIPPNFPLGCGPGPDPPQFPTWVWAWRGVSFLGGLLGGVSLEGGASFLGGFLGGGASFLGDSPWKGASFLGGSLWMGGLLGRGVVSQHALRQTPPWTESHTAVKTLPWPQLRCGRYQSES